MKNGQREDLTDHDLLIRIDERVKKLDKCMTNHLHHHWIVTAAAVSAALTALAAVAVAVISR